MMLLTPKNNGLHDSDDDDVDIYYLYEDLIFSQVAGGGGWLGCSRQY